MNICQFCNTEYEPNPSTIARYGKQIFCGRKCSGRAHGSKKKKRIIIKNNDLCVKLEKIAANKDYTTNELAEIIIEGWIQDTYPKHGPDPKYVQDCLN